MLGKQKCRILKEIRQRIADENDIPYVTRECTFQGECRGTCPRCESELRYLERELALRASLKKGVTVAALCAGMTGMAFVTSGCSSSTSSSSPVTTVESPTDDLSGAMAPDDAGTQDTGEDYIEELTGEIDESYYEDYGGNGETGENAADYRTIASTDPEFDWTLTGDVDESSSGISGGSQISSENGNTGETAAAASTIEAAAPDDGVIELTGEVAYP